VEFSEDEKRYLVAYYSRKFSDEEVNYDVHHKEMSAIVATFTECDQVLRSFDEEIVVYTDLRNLEYCNNTKILSRRQHCWADFLQPFNFKLVS